MKTLTARSRSIFTVALIAAVIVAMGIFGRSAHAVQTLSGYAWSSNIGWICFGDTTNCPTATLTVNSNNTITGWGWSSSIGWIKFGGFNINTLPTGGGAVQDNAKIDSSGDITGWARACEGTVNGDCTSASRTDGWDGWIALSGTTWGVKTAVNNSSYDPSVSGAWGGEVVGWLAFNISANALPTCSMNANPPELYAQALPASMILTYNTANASSATINHGVGSVSPTGTSKTISPPSVTTTYTMTVTNVSGGSGTCRTTVTVHAGFPPPGGCMTVSDKTNAYNPSCTNPVKSISIQTGTRALLYWNVANVTGCTITTNNGGVWGSGNGSQGNPGLNTGVLTQKTEFEISCPSKNDGDPPFTDSVTINIIPVFQEI